MLSLIYLRRAHATGLCLVLAGLTACSSTLDMSVPQTIKPYKPEVIQGNFVSSEQVAALQEGMPREQVRQILGTPLLMDIFHPDRWDYVFTIEQAGDKTQTLRLTVYFNRQNQLSKWEGDQMPSEAAFVKTLNSGRKAGKIPPLVATEKELASFSQRNNAQKPVATKSGSEESTNNSNKIYPPLESNQTTKP